MTNKRTIEQTNSSAKSSPHRIRTPLNSRLSLWLVEDPRILTGQKLHRIGSKNSNLTLHCGLNHIVSTSIGGNANVNEAKKSAKESNKSIANNTQNVT